MKFLLDANMPRSALHALVDAGYEVSHVRDLGLGDAPDAEIDQFALTQSWVLVTRDTDFCDVRTYPPESSPGRLVLRLPDTTVASDIADLVRRFLLKPDLVEQLPGHLAILDNKRIRFRPALTTHDT
ncbi:hypothetical protein PC39_03037 [Salinisphaera sp. PC39]|uniref:DUF5615 family PIN-like protein n=1 Tax=Salinisphaera sp. PC39 TaxID=1304156 RepID=UPI003342A4E4